MKTPSMTKKVIIVSLVVPFALVLLVIGIVTWPIWYPVYRLWEGLSEAYDKAEEKLRCRQKNRTP